MKLLSIILLSFSSLCADTITAELTAYCSCQKCCSWHFGKDGLPKFDLRPKQTKIVGQTASGAIARQGLTLAMPKGFAFGTHVYDSKGNLVGVCEDRGGAIKIKSGIVRIDVYFSSHKDALVFGRKKNLLLTIKD